MASWAPTATNGLSASRPARSAARFFSARFIRMLSFFRSCARGVGGSGRVRVPIR
jgi:hypothetical protein